MSTHKYKKKINELEDRTMQVTESEEETKKRL